MLDSPTTCLPVINPHRLSYPSTLSCQDLFLQENCNNRFSLAASTSSFPPLPARTQFLLLRTVSLVVSYLYVSSSCLFHHLHFHFCSKSLCTHSRNKNTLDSPTGSLTVSVFNAINNCCLSNCMFSPKLLTRRAELPIQACSKHSLRKHAYAASFNSIFPFVGRQPATIRKSLRSQPDASSL
jgi:hypothetical protein